MVKLSIKTLKLLRTLIILIGIIAGFIIWLFVPHFIKNNATFHVGNGAYGSKLGMLLLLPMPLLSMLFRGERDEFHGSDLEYQKQAEEMEMRKALTIQIIAALSYSLMVIIFMLIGTCM